MVLQDDDHQPIQIAIMKITLTGRKRLGLLLPQVSRETQLLSLGPKGNFPLYVIVPNRILCQDTPAQTGLVLTPTISSDQGNNQSTEWALSISLTYMTTHLFWSLVL